MKVTVFTGSRHNNVYHTRCCQVIRNRNTDNMAERQKEQMEAFGYQECSYCARTNDKPDGKNWRKSLKRMINDGDVEIESPR